MKGQEGQKWGGGRRGGDTSSELPDGLPDLSVTSFHPMFCSLSWIGCHPPSIKLQREIVPICQTLQTEH